MGGRDDGQVLVFMILLGILIYKMDQVPPTREKNAMESRRCRGKSGVGFGVDLSHLFVS